MRRRPKRDPGTSIPTGPPARFPRPSRASWRETGGPWRPHAGHRHVPSRSRFPRRPPRGLRDRLPRVPLAGAGSLQLGAGLVRHPGRRQRAHCSPPGGGGRAGGAAQLRPARRAIQSRSHLLPAARRRARAPHPHDAAQLRPDLGCDAGRHEAGGGGDPGQHPAHARGPPRADRARQRHARGDRRRGHREAAGHRRRVHPARGRRAGPGLASVRAGRRGVGRLHLALRDALVRSGPALLHQRHHRPAQAGGPHPRQLSGGPPLDHVLARPPRGRRPHERIVAGLGEARLVQLLRPLQRRRHRLRLQLRALQRPRAADDHGPPPGDHVLRTAHRLAHAGPRGPVGSQARAARGAQRRRAAQPGGDREGPERLGRDHPRRLRTDRDHRPDRQHARPAGQAGLHGTAAARVRHRAGRCGG